MKIDILTLFPEMFTGVFETSIIKKAQEKDAVHLGLVNFRDFANNKHHIVDDYPYGGGDGMVLKPEPMFEAVESITSYQKARIIMMTPQGKRYNQKIAEELKNEKHLIFLCGHYEGFDERIRDELVTDELSIGDYVLTGGELAAMVMIDSIIRLLPNVLGSSESALNDSFSTGLLEYPQYTRPETYRGLKVPDILLSGHHKNIEAWRRREAIKRTFKRRPDMLDKSKLSKEDIAYLQTIEDE